METILYEVQDGIAKITLNRPDVLNSINPQLIADIREAIKQANDDKAAGAILMTGAGRGFCAGADLASPGARKEGASTGENVAYGMEIGYNPLIREIAGSRKPVIAAVNGVTAGGGCGLALAADIVIAGKSASFVQVFGPQLALIPDMGCTWFLPNLVGRARARGMALLGEKLPAETAAEWGLIWKCVEDDALMEEATKIAAKLAGGPSNAFGEIKRALDTALHNDLSTQLDYERDTQGMLGDHPNFSEGVTAFLQKRKPDFQ